MADTPNFTASQDAVIVASKLKEIAVGDTISYADISRLIGRDICENRSILQTARKIAFREANAVFVAVTGVGVKRAEDVEIVGKSASTLSRVQRSTRKSLKELAVVKFAELTNEQKLQHNAVASQLGALNMMASKPATKKIEKRVVQTAERIPFAKIAELFGKPVKEEET